MASYKFRIGEALSFNDIINAIFNDFFYIDENINPYDMKTIQLIDMDEMSNENFVREFNVSYKYSGTFNKIDLMNNETGELFVTIHQEPIICPNSHSRWYYHITYCSWDFDPSFKIEDGYYIVIF